MTIAPGTTVQFGQGDGLDVEGALSANGTSAQPIAFTSDAATPAPGDWAGIIFSDFSTGGLNYARVSYAGGDCGCGALTAIQVDNATPSFAHTTIDHSAGNGVEVARGGQPLLQNVTLSFNGNYPLQYDTLPTNLGQFSAITSTGNTHNMLNINGGGTYTSTVSSPNFGIPYLVQGGGVSASDGGQLSVASGDTLKFAKNSGSADLLEVDNGSTLTMNGTAAKPIRLTSGQAKPAPGDWGGLLLLAESSATLHDVQVTYAGGSTGYTPSTGIYVNGSNPSITNTTISLSSGNDVDVSNAMPILKYNNFLKVPTGKFGVINEGWSSGQPLLDASRNWWASNGGPGAGGTPVSAGVTFKPWLSLKVTPTSGGPGSTATVAGTGYAPNETVTVKWDCLSAGCSNSTSLVTLHAGSTGSFSGGITIPSNTSLGNHTIGVLGSSSGAFLTTVYSVT